MFTGAARRIGTSLWRGVATRRANSSQVACSAGREVVEMVDKLVMNMFVVCDTYQGRWDRTRDIRGSDKDLQCSKSKWRRFSLVSDNDVWTCTGAYRVGGRQC